MTKEYKDLMDLVDLAERVADKIERDDRQMDKFFVRIFFLFGLLFGGLFVYLSWSTVLKFSFESRDRFFSVFFILALVLFFFIVNAFSRLFKVREEQSEEVQNLYKLMEMTNELRNAVSNNAFSELSVVENALLDMRLRRIKFSTRRSFIDIFAPRRLPKK